MNKRSKYIIFQSGVVALVISLILPTAWVITLSEARTSPIITTTERDVMSPAEHAAWFEKNAKPASLFHRIQSIPHFIQNNWAGFLEASAAIFIIVFLMNYFVLIFLHAKP